MKKTFSQSSVVRAKRKNKTRRNVKANYTIVSSGEQPYNIGQMTGIDESENNNTNNNSENEN